MNRMDGPPPDPLPQNTLVWASRLLDRARGEVGKVVWPTRRALLTYSAVVLLCAGALTLVVVLLDVLFSRLSG
jgi:preprotein translocase SecE subunit